MKNKVKPIKSLLWISTVRVFFCLLFCWACPLLGQAGKKKELRPQDYSLWHTLLDVKIAPNGGWTSYHLNYESGQDTLVLQNITNKTTSYFPSARSESFLKKGKCFVYIENDSLKILDLQKNTVIGIPNIKSYKVSDDNQYLAGIKEVKEKVQIQNELQVFNIEKGLLTTIPNVVEYSFNPTSNRLVFIQKENQGYKVGAISLDDNNVSITILKESKNPLQNLAFGARTSLAFFENIEPNNNKAYWFKNISYANQYHVFNPNVQKLLQDTIRVLNTVSTTLHFSKDEDKLFFHIQKIENNQKVNNHGTKVQVWNTRDKVIYPTRADSESYFKSPPKLVVWDIKKNTLLLLGNDTSSKSVWGSGNKYTYSYNILDDIKPSSDRGLDSPVYVYDIETGTSRLVLNRKHNMPIKVSPTGRYLSYFNETDWWVFDAENYSHTNISKGVPAVFKNEEYDWSGPTPPYGNPGWSEGETSILLYDKSDVWAIAPNGQKAQRLTSGNEQAIVYRLIEPPGNVNTFAGYLTITYNLKKGVSLKTKHINNGKTGYSFLYNNDLIERLEYAPAQVNDLKKATESNVFVYTLERFDNPPALMALKKDEKKPTLLFQSNPQAIQYNWGKSELLNYTLPDGTALKGALFYPSDFNPKRKYPTVVYIYQKLSDRLHKYQNPSLLTGFDLNITNFTTNGYFVFCPDIAYQLNEPGISALRSVTTGVEKILQYYYINKDRLGLFGHSFGGYETSFIVSQTDIFKAAITGAGIQDLRSFYFSMAWLWGRPQSDRFLNHIMRFKKNYFEIPQQYENNNPLKFAKSIKTPLLSITGIEDSNVNWQQSVELFNALRILKKEHIMLLYPDEGHAFFGKENQIDLTYKMWDWFNHYLKDEKAAPWMGEFK